MIHGFFYSVLNNKPTKNKYKLLKVSSEILVAMLSLDGSKLVKVKGMPDDAVLTGGYYCLETDAFVFRVESDSFAIVREGHYPGNLDLTVYAEEIAIAEEIKE